MAFKLTQQQSVFILLSLLIVSLYAGFNFGLFTPQRGDVITQGEVLSISPTYYETYEGFSSPIVIAQLALTGAGDWVVGETASTTTNSWLNTLIPGIGVKPTVPIEIGATIKDNGCKYVLQTKTESGIIENYNKVRLQYANVRLQALDSKVDFSCKTAPQVIAGITFSGDTCAYVGNGLAIGCENSYENICESNPGFKAIRCKSNPLGINFDGYKCVKLSSDTTYTPAISTSKSLYTRIEGTVYANNQPTETFVCDSASGSGCVVSDVGGTSVLKRVNLIGGFVQYETTQCPDSITGVWYNGNKQFRVLSNALISSRPPKPILASDMRETELQASINNWNTYIDRFLTTNPDNELLIPLKDTLPNKTSATESLFKVNQGVKASSTPLISLYLDANNVGVRNIPVNVDLSCPTNILTGRVGGSPVSFTITATNLAANNGNAEISMDTTACPGVSRIAGMPDSISFTTSQTSLVRNYQLYMGNVGESTCKIQVKERSENRITDTCILNLKGERICTPETAPPRPSGDYWELNPNSCSWECKPFSCSAGTHPVQATCSCVQDVVGECPPDQSTNPGNAHWLPKPNCIWECNSGYIPVWDNSLRKTICIQQTINETATCYQRVEARICEPWDLFCPINKNIDKLGCSLQELFTNTVYIVIGISLIIAISLGVFILLKKRRIK